VAPVTTACGEPFPAGADVGATTVTPGPSPAAQDGFALVVAVLPLGPALLALALAALMPLPLVPPLGVADALAPNPDAATATAAKTPPAANPLRMFIYSSPRRRNAG
jgi:hypothetical protein